MSSPAETLSAIETEIKQFVNKHQGKSRETDARLLALEQTFTRSTHVGGEGFGEKSLGQTIVESEGFAALQKGAQSSGRNCAQVSRRSGTENR
jgi:hypothetical protein